MRSANFDYINHNNHSPRHYPSPTPYHPIHHISPHHHHTPVRNTLSNTTRCLLCTYYSPDLLFLFFLFFFSVLCFLLFFSACTRGRSPHPSISILWLSRIAFALQRTHCARMLACYLPQPLSISRAGRAATGASCNTVLTHPHLYPCFLPSFCVSISISVSVSLYLSVSVSVSVSVYLSIVCVLCNIFYLEPHIMWGAIYGLCGSRGSVCRLSHFVHGAILVGAS